MKTWDFKANCIVERKPSFDVEIWTVKLTAKHMQTVFNKWEKINQYE